MSEQSPHILVILDKPKHAQAALQRAREITSERSAHLHLASFCWLPMAEYDDVFDTHQRRALKQAAVQERQQWLRDLVVDSQLSAADVSTEVVWTQDIAGWVEQYETTQQPDLIVKSVHRNSRSLTHTPLDWRLLRETRTPVWLVVHDMPMTAGPILATIDLRHTDTTHQLLNQKVLDQASALASVLNRPLHCVHAVESSAAPRLLDRLTRQDLEQRLHERSARLLSALAKPYGIATEATHIVQGKVGHAVRETSASLDAAVLVVGTSARHGPQKFLGASAEKILALANSDILAVHGD